MAVDSCSDLFSVEAIINKVGEDFKLNEKWWVAFRIVARSFVQSCIQVSESDNNALQLLKMSPS